MQVRSRLFSVVIIISGAAMLGGVSAQAQERATREGERLRQLCDRGDQKACVRFGMLLSENRNRHEEWRRSNPQFWSYEGDRAARAKSSAQTERGGTNLPWCGVPYGSTRECVYQTIGQCEQDMRPLGGDCDPRD